ncbi:MAG: energy-coupling factor transporter transmembrane protein EcfT [Bacilli bacterium]
MYSRNTFGSYFPVDSMMHKISPVVKIINLFLFLIFILFSNNLKLHLFFGVFLVLMIINSKVPLRYYINMIFGGRYLFVFLIFLLAFLGVSFSVTLDILLKVIYLILYLALVIFTSSSSELSYGIQKVLKPFNLFNLNMAGFSIKVVNVIKFIPTVIMSEQKILKYLASRGIDYYNSSIVGKFYAVSKSIPNTLRVAKRSMNEYKIASEERLFDKTKPRTMLVFKKIGFNDVFLIAFHVLFIIGYVLQRGRI